MGQVPCSQVLHQTLEEEEEKEKLLLGLVEKALQRGVGVGEKHSLRRNSPHLQVGEEVAAAALWGRIRIKVSLNNFLLLAGRNPRRGLEGITASRSPAPIKDN